ncbi:MAG TPA: tetratricopeptide repeat protein [Pyrinomonadaceae bacterium]|nr:tetratricopeptide repeat protein [Pyrinomonadaceae bacterium]
MTLTAENSPQLSHRRSTIILSAIIVAGLVGAGALGRWLELRRPPAPAAAEETLYMEAATVKRLSLGFNGLVADWYWMRALQYVGRKILNRGDAPLDDLRQLDLRLLAPLLETTTTLDPQFLQAYEYGAVVLPAIDPEAAIRLTRQGIAANPETWRLYQHLGYIYWQQGRYQEAAQVYREGAQVPGAPAWMEAMAARMEAEGGSRAFARVVFLRLYEQAANEQVRDMARRRLMQLQALDEQDFLERILTAFRERAGRCPADWREVAPLLRRAQQLRLDAAGAPLDPAGVPYLLETERCVVNLDPRTEVPRDRFMREG